MVISSSQTMDLEARFGHIIQPIRDLTRNWDIDIARYLGEYLEDLEKIVVTFDSGQTTMNFAEAALLIQGSACVYSKKVEYLYSLVYQVLDMIANKKKNEKTAENADGQDVDADFQEDGRDEFLTLDDMKETRPEKLQARDDPDKDSQVIPQTPMNLIALEEGEKDQNELHDLKGEVLGNLSDFQMNRSNLQPSGGVYLDTSLLHFLNSHLQLLASSTPYPNHEKMPPQFSQTESDVREENAQKNFSELPPMEQSVNDGGDHRFEPIDDMSEVQKTQTETVPPQRCERKKVHFAISKPPVNYWELTDPYSTVPTVVEKNLKTGRLLKLPHCIEPEINKKRKRRAPEKKLLPMIEFQQIFLYSHKSKFPKNPSRVPNFSELDDIFWKEYKRRQEVQRHERKLQNVPELAEDLIEGEENFQEENWAADVGNSDDGGNKVAEEIEALDLQIEDNIFTPVEAFGGEFINTLGSSRTLANSYEELVRKHVENFMASAAKFAQISELSKRVADWEEKITPKLLEEEQRDAFDIHQYGTSVLAGLHKGQKVLFARLVTGKPVFQICRMFLATLQLANAYNVELTCPGHLEEGMDKLELRLLSTKRHYEELAEYQAPSLTSKQ